MKFVKIFLEYRKTTESELKKYIQKNMTQEMINGLEYDDPKAIKRALKMFGIEYDPDSKTSFDSNEETALDTSEKVLEQKNLSSKKVSKKPGVSSKTIKKKAS